MIRAASIAVLALLSSGLSFAQEPAPTIDASESVVVIGRTEEVVRNFVGAMSVAPRGNDQLARWDRRICPGVAGLRPRYAQFLIDRMAQRAFDVGLDVGEPGCRANILIVVTPDPDGVALDLYENHAGALGYFDNGRNATRGRDALRETFVNSDAPVRWWHVSDDTNVDGMPIAEPPGAPCSMGPDVYQLLQCAPVTRPPGASRIRAMVRQDFGAAFVIVDANRLPETGPDFNALADYIAMVSLSQLDPMTDVSAYPTVLNLWRAGGAAPDAMTDWDVSYLRGLYATRTRDVRDTRAQESSITREMMRDGD
jgi:hypothetical protein